MEKIRKITAVFMHYWHTSRFFREFVLFLVSIITGGFLGLFYLIQGILYDSDWFMSLAVYNGLLTLIRIYLCNRKWVLHHESHPALREEISRRSMETTGVLLALMNVSLSVMMGEMIFFGHSKSYWFLMRLYIIIYTCFRVWIAAKSAYHGRKRNRIQRMIQALNVMDGLVGIFSLTATLIDTYAHDFFLRTPILLILGLVIIGMLIMASDYMMMASVRNERNRK